MRSQTTFLLFVFLIIQQTSAYNIYVFVTRMKEFVDGPFAYIFAEETLGNRDCQYLSVTTSYVKEYMNFTQNDCSSTLYPPMAAVFTHPLYPRNISHVISKDEKLTFMCTPLRDYTENDSMEYNCALKRPNSAAPPISSAFNANHAGDFAGQIAIIPALIILAILLLLASFLFKPSRPVLQ